MYLPPQPHPSPSLTPTQNPLLQQAHTNQKKKEKGSAGTDKTIQQATEGNELETAAHNSPPNDLPPGHNHY